MTYATRRYIFFASVFVFFMVSVPLLLYTFGYRFSFSEFSFRETGGIFIHANPLGALVTVDSVTKTTSFITGNAFIQNLRPGNHIVSVSKEKSQTWQKTMLVLPQGVTEAYPLLMPSHPFLTPTRVASSTALIAIPESDYIFIQNSNNQPAYYQIYDTASGKILPYTDAISRKNATGIDLDTIVSWQPVNTSTVIFETANDWFLLQHLNDTIQLQSLYRQSKLSKLLTDKPSFIARHPHEDSIYFILYNDTLARWNTKTESIQQLLQSIAGFHASNDNLVLWDTQSGFPYRTLLDTTNAKALATTSASSVINKTRLFESTTALAAVSDNGLWIIPHHTKEPRRVTEAYNQNRIIMTDAYLLWWNDKTINIYWTLPIIDMPAFQTTRQETIHKTEKTLKFVAPYPRESYIIIQEDNNIYTLELDGRGGSRNKHSIYEGTDPAIHLFLNEQTLYISDNGSLVTVKLP